MFVTRGDRVMPSVAIVAARFSARFGIGVYGSNLFANTVVDPAKKSGKAIAVYFDSDDEGKEGGNVRTLAGSPAYYVDRMIVSASDGDSASANALLRRHVNFLCSVRSEPVFCDEDQVWYRFMHIALLGRPKRPGRTTAGMDLYEATLRVMWRPMSAQDPDYAAVTGISAT